MNYTGPVTAVRRIVSIVILGAFGAAAAAAQAYSPKVLLKGQPDASDLQKLVEGILSRARATTPHERAEAIWRFFLTDGRFVAPGFWYHIDGFAYEEPKGEVLDPLKLLNSYGFGLCYHIAAVLEAVYKAAGFEDARVWFLTGHTVTEVYYDGAYHYYDSDMMGYNTIGKSRTVASVSEVAADRNIMLSKVGTEPKEPWYPADVAAGAIPDLATIFSSTNDNWLFPFQRHAQGHSMDFVLRPGERLIRYFGSEDGLFYLPYTTSPEGWKEFAGDVGRFRVRDGPQARTDLRQWGTGRLEYRPPLWDEKAFDRLDNVKPATGGGGALSRLDPARPASATIEVASPYVLIDAKFSMELSLAEGDEAAVETSTDNGQTWEPAGRVAGPHRGPWETGTKVVTQSKHGRMETVSGKYRYAVRLTMNGPAGHPLEARNLFVLSRFQYNPRTAPAVTKGLNEMVYEPGPQRRRWEIPLSPERIDRSAYRNTGLVYTAEGDQGMLLPDAAGGEAIYEVSAPDASPLTGVDAGGRFLDLRDGLAPDKHTAETRPTRLGGDATAGRAESLEWSLSPDGPYTTLWKYDPQPQWKDGKPVAQLLRWPEVDRQIRDLPPDTRKIYVKYRLAGGMALDDVRLAVIGAPARKPSSLEIIHVWFEAGKEQSHVERIEDPAIGRSYVVNVRGKGEFRNYGVILSCPPPEPPR
jgi:hypothetical protein